MPSISPGGKRKPFLSEADQERLTIHVDYLRRLADRIEGTDAESVRAAAGLLEEFGNYFRNTATWT